MNWFLPIGPIPQHNNMSTPQHNQPTYQSTLSPELAWALTTLRGQAFKLWVAAKALGLKTPNALTGKALSAFGLSSDVCAKYRDLVFSYKGIRDEGLEVLGSTTEGAMGSTGPTGPTWENYYPLYLEALATLNLGSSFWSIGRIHASYPTLFPRTLVRCALRFANEIGWDDGIEANEFLEMMLAKELEALKADEEILDNFFGSRA